MTLHQHRMANILWLNNTENDVVFSNEHTAVFLYPGTHNIDLGMRVMYRMSPDWWGYVGYVTAKVLYNFTTEFIVQYDTSVAGFSTPEDAYDHFNKIM